MLQIDLIFFLNEMETFLSLSPLLLVCMLLTLLTHDILAPEIFPHNFIIKLQMNRMI